jgi:hypothetical protein
MRESFRRNRVSSTSADRGGSIVRSLGRAAFWGLAFALVAAPAQGATTIGKTFDPTTNSAIGAASLIQNASPGNGYAAPTAGVITAWSFQASASGTVPIKLKVFRSAGATDYLTVDESEQVVPTAGVLNTFPTTIPVKAGDLLGLYVSSESPAGKASAPGYFYGLTPGDPIPGSTKTFFEPTDNRQLDVSAQFEPDADGDGFGDETQDLCPTDPSRQTACAVPLTDTTPPETTITAMPRARIHKGKANIAFTSSEADSSFECRLDHNFDFGPCPTPLSVNAKRGKHTIEVRAKDAAGNVDTTPAVATWKVVKKKKHHHHH